VLCMDATHPEVVESLLVAAAESPCGVFGVAFEILHFCNGKQVGGRGVEFVITGSGEVVHFDRWV